MRLWYISHHADPRAVRLADKHYSRKKPGSPQFCPPGRKLVLLTEHGDALWCTSYPFAEYVNREYPDAWCCTIFRNESDVLSSELIRQAVAATRWKYGEPPASGMVTMVNTSKVRSSNPGCCFKKAGFKHVGYTKGGLYMLQLLPKDMPSPDMPYGVQLSLFEEAA